MGTGDILLEGNHVIDWHAVQVGKTTTPRHAYKFRPFGPLARVRLNL